MWTDRNHFLNLSSSSIGKGLCQISASYFHFYNYANSTKIIGQVTHFDKNKYIIKTSLIIGLNNSGKDEQCVKSVELFSINLGKASLFPLKDFSV